MTQQHVWAPEGGTVHTKESFFCWYAVKDLDAQAPLQSFLRHWHGWAVCMYSLRTVVVKRGVWLQGPPFKNRRVLVVEIPGATRRSRFVCCWFVFLLVTQELQCVVTSKRREDQYPV